MNPCPTQPSPITPSRRFPATAGLRLNCSATKGGLDSDDKTTENAGMEIRGRVHNGVVVLEGEFPLPEGTEVIVSSGAAPETKPVEEQRIEFPLVRSKHPGSLRLTGQRVAEFLEEDDVPA